MCFSFNDAANRAEFLADEDAYMRQVRPERAAARGAIRTRHVLELIAAGGNVYYLAKFAGIFGLDVQDIGAQQTGMTKDEFKAKLHARRRLSEGTRPWPRSSAASPPRTSPPSAAPSHKGLQQDPYWKPFFDGFPPVRQWLAEVKPDVVVVFYNDHGLNFFLDKMPTFAVGAAPEYHNADEGWGIPTLPPFQGDPDLSWHIINTWWPTGVRRHHLPGDAGRPRLHPADEAALAGRRLPGAHRAGVHQHRAVPAALGRRCYALGKAVGEAIESWDSDKKVAVIGTGGLSHQLDGERAGFINKEFDLQFMDSLRRRTRNGRRNSASTNWSRRPARRASSC